MSAHRATMPPRLLVFDRDSRYAEWLRRHLGVLCPDAIVSVIDAVEFADVAKSVTSDDCDVLLFVSTFGSAPEDPVAFGLDLLRQFRSRSAFLTTATRGRF